MKYRIIILILLVSFIGCKKDESANKTYTISGTLNFDCNTPFANSDLQFYENATFLSHGGTIGTVKTDANGHFTFTYTARRNSTTLSILTLIAGISPSCILDNIPEDCDLPEFNLYYKTLSYRIFKVSCTTPLTSNDTLYVGYSTNSYKYYVGPISNGTILDTIQITMSNNTNYNYINYPIQVLKFIWGVGYSNFFGMHIISYNHDITCGKYNVATIPIN